MADQKIPSDTLLKLVQSVGKIEATTDNIDRRVSRIESSSPIPLRCLHPEEIAKVPVLEEKVERIDKIEEIIAENDRRSIKNETNISGLSKWRWALMSSIMAIAAAVTTCAFTSRDSVTTNTADIGANKATIKVNTEAIKSVVEDTKKTRESVLRIETKINNTLKVEKPPEKNGTFITIRVDKLRPYEKRQANKLERLSRER